MANQKISQLTEKSAVVSDDLFVIANSEVANTNNKVKFSSIETLVANTGTAPISVTNKVISIAQANDTTDGYLISDDWNTFNEKEDVQFVTADASSTTATLTLEENTCYTFATALTALTLSNYVNSTKEIEIHFTTASSFSFTASGWMGKWCGGVPTFEASTGYVIALKNGLGVIGKVGA